MQSGITLTSAPKTGIAELRQTPDRIFVDATYTLCSGKNSGIERVVRSIIRESQALCSELVPQLVIAHEGEFYALSDAQLKRLAKPAGMQGNVQSNLPKIYHKLASAVCKAIPSRTLRKWILPEAGHLGMFKLPHTFYEYYSRSIAVQSATRVQPSENDLFLLPDAYWARRGIWPAVEQAKASGAMIATLLYDLIPITHQEFVHPRRTEVFKQYLFKLATKSDLIVAISDTVRDQAKAYLPELCEEHQYCQDLRSFELGAELSAAKGKLRSRVTDLFNPQSGNTPYLMVATFDPRKNHRYLIDAFDKLWQTRPDLKLCLIGRVGWLCEDLLIELEKHPLRNKQLFIFHDLTDSELHHCYRHGRGVVFPSIVEGFGLPIVESLWHGQKTFASDTPIHREVGRDDCTYFDLATPQSLVDGILDWESQLAESKPRLPVRQPLAWSESNLQLFNHCLDAFRSRQSNTRVHAFRKAA